MESAIKPRFKGGDKVLILWSGTILERNVIRKAGDILSSLHGKVISFEYEIDQPVFSCESHDESSRWSEDETSMWEEKKLFRNIDEIIAFLQTLKTKE